ncbi:hypothetical protein [Sulfoacidibacillus thermotolerans]|nr:hypothetical protein [Sulfoacidibacillus thermotolerans]
MKIDTTKRLLRIGTITALCMTVSGCATTPSTVSSSLHTQNIKSVQKPLSKVQNYAPLTIDSSLQLALPDSIGTLHRDLLQQAFLTTSGRIVVNHMTYQINLPAHTRLMYLLQDNGILWTVQPRGGIQGNQPLVNSLFFTPFVSSDFMEHALPRMTTSLTDNATLLFRTNQVYTDHVSNNNGITLYQDHSAILFSYILPIDGQKMIQFAILTNANTAIQLLGQYPLRPVPPVVMPITNGVIYERYSPSHLQREHVFIYRNFAANTTVVFHTSFQAQAFYSNTSSALVIAGPEQISINAKGQITHAQTPPLPLNPLLLNALQPLHMPEMYLPSISFQYGHSSIMPILLTVKGPSLYEIRLTLQNPSTILQVTVAKSKQALHKYRIHIEHIDTKSLILPTKNLFVHSVTPIPSFYGAYQPLTSMILSSQQGPEIEWIRAIEKQSQKVKNPTLHSATWFAAFAIGNWTYMLGPFTNPANTNQTNQLSQFITAITSNPLPDFAQPGWMAIKLQKQTTTWERLPSLIEFSPAKGISVHIKGISLLTTQQLQFWTLTTKPSAH